MAEGSVGGGVERGVDQQAADGHLFGGAIHQAPAAGVSQVAGGGGVGRVVTGVGPLGTSDVVAVVVVDSQHILHGEDVAVGGQTQILLDTFGHNARGEQVDGVLHRVSGGTAGQVGELVVDHHAETGEEGHLGLGYAHATATPGHGTTGGESGGAEGQHPHLLQVVGHVGVHGDGVEVVASLAELGLSGHHVGNVQEVGLGHGTGDTSERFVGLVGTKHASAGDTTEETQQLGGEGGGLQLVDGGGQLVADVSQGVGARAQLAEVVSGIGEATVQDRHDLLVGGHVLGNEVAAATTPGAGAEDLGLSRGDRVEERHAHAGAAGAGVESGIALHDAALDPLRLLEDALGGVLQKFGTGDEVRQESRARAVVTGERRHGLAPVESGLGRAPHRG